MVADTVDAKHPEIFDICSSGVTLEAWDKEGLVMDQAGSYWYTETPITG